jgi:nucleotidyltransferase substrate binding protein (TIGR01987 family)
MDTTGKRIGSLKKALATLEEAAGLPETPIVRDAVIQRFEYTFDLLWKCVRAVLAEAHGLECNSPKSCFREAFSVRLSDAGDTEALLEMTDDRNATTRIYPETEAIRIRGRIGEVHLPLIKRLTEAIQGQAALGA